MNELKFRAWDYKTKRMLSSDCSDLVIHLNGLMNSSDNGFFRGILNTRQLPLMQYLGIKDKNGVKVCEGDAVKVVRMGGYSSGYSREWSRPIEVRRSERGGFYPLETCEWWVDEETGNITSIEVIGNVYENPELFCEEMETSEIRLSDCMKSRRK